MFNINNSDNWIVFESMRDNYVNNMEEILSANDTQKNKIEFLQRERVKRDHYLQDLHQNLLINKETIKQLNRVTSQDQAVAVLTDEALFLSNKIKQYYEEYQNINAVLLMETQLRSQDRQFYQERILQFQNRIVDLRKYLQDKEESFTSVILRLKKYEELSQPTIDEKLKAFKKDIGQQSVTQFIMELVKEKNYYKNAFEKQRAQFLLFTQLQQNLVALYPDIAQIIEVYKTKHGLRISQLVKDHYFKGEEEKEKKNPVVKKIEPNKELLRLLKKQKLNNELLEEALNQAIEKNEQLIVIKDSLQKMVERWQKKYQLLYAESTVISLRLAEYDHHFSRYLSHNRRYYQEGDSKGLQHIVNNRLKEYGRTLKDYFESNSELYKRCNQKFRQDVQKWSMFICDAHLIKKSIRKEQLLTKSCSVPSLLSAFELQGEGQEELIIEQF